VSYGDEWQCVVCGKYIGNRYGEGGNHHCDPKRLAKIDNSRKAHDELTGNREPSDAQRLSMGNFLLSPDGDD
jgi:hypothetical protein